MERIKNKIKKIIGRYYLSKQNYITKSLHKIIFTQERDIEHIRKIKQYFKSNIDETNEYEYLLDNSVPDKNLRVAVCISGFMRSFRDVAPAYIKHIIQRYNADVFIFCPTQPDLKSLVKIGDNELEEIYGNNLKKSGLWDYNPAIFEDMVKSNKIENAPLNVSPVNFLSSSYHFKKCNELKQEYERERGIKYDWVIKIRPDLGLFTPLRLEVLNEKNTVYYPKYNNFTKEGYRCMWLQSVHPYRNVERGEYIGSGEIVFNDFINIMSSENADGLAELYDNITEYYRRGVLYNPETLIAYHMIFEKKKKIKMVDFVTCCLHRPDNPVIWNPYIQDKNWGYYSKFAY